MAVKTAKGRLYTLLAACKPDNKQAEKRLAYIELLESTEYRELAECELFHKSFEKLFSPEVLWELDAQKLRRVRAAAALIPVAAERTANAIYYGNGWALNMCDAPDFYSTESIASFVSKLDFSTIYFNDTNIPPEDFTEIFSADKSPVADRTAGFYCIKREDDEI